MSSSARRRRSWVLLLAATLFFLSADSLSVDHAFATIRFGRTDVRTVFHIAKSDDHNRVDYGVRLDEQCRPLGREPVYAYWHRFEPGEPRVGELNMMDRQVYGITSQSVRTRSDSGSWIEMHVAAMPDLRILILAQPHDGGCVARAQIPVNRRPAFVDRVFVQLSSGIVTGVESVRFSGVDVQTQRRVSELRRR